MIRIKYSTIFWILAAFCLFMALTSCAREQHARATTETFIRACDTSTIEVEQHTANGRSNLNISCQAY